MRLARTILALCAVMTVLGSHDAHAQTAMGAYARFRTQASHPVPPAGFINVWCKTSDSKCYQTTSSGTDTALSGGGGGSTGNYTFSGNTLDLSGAATMAIAPTTATAITLGQNVTISGSKSLTLGTGTLTLNGAVSIASGVDITAVGGASDLDLSASSGVLKTPTGAITLSGSSYAFNSAFTKALIEFSIVDMANALGASSTTGNNTVGQKILFKHPVSVTGVRFYWPGGLGALSYKCSLWDHTNTRVGNATVSVNAAGIGTASFSPVTVAASDLYQNYWVGCYETSGTNYTYITPAPGRPANPTSNVPYSQSDWVQLIDDSMYSAGAGDAQPTTSGGGTSFYFAVEVLFTVP